MQKPQNIGNQTILDAVNQLQAEVKNLKTELTH